MRIVFMGTPDFAVPALKALVAAGHEVVAVYTQPPRPKGRGQMVQKSPVHVCAEDFGLPVFTPTSFKKEPDAVTAFSAHKADCAVVAAYGLILPQTVLDAPRFGCLNIHASLLPRWRGAAPIQRAIWAGDAQSGITIMQMEAGLDTGLMLLKDSIAITPETTAQKLHDALSTLGGRLIIEALAQLQNLAPEQQDDAQAIYAHMLRKEDGQINWQQTALEIDRQIRALNPWPGTFTTGPKGRVKILSAQIDAATTHQPSGLCIDENARIACGGGTILQLLQVQPENTKPMSGADALRGGYLAIGTVLS